MKVPFALMVNVIILGLEEMSNLFVMVFVVQELICWSENANVIEPPQPLPSWAGYGAEGM